MPRISFLLKALNEEAHIAQCLDSIVSEARGLDVEIILVDSCSTDRTLEIARAYPVRVVQFAERRDRGCAAAVQLGYQCAQGDYLYVIDGDMTLVPGFLREAQGYLEAHPDVAGVGGVLRDNRINNAADKRRAGAYSAVAAISDASDLGGGGLYRRRAIEAVGYLSHRWLPACEEAELGVRLRMAGWRLRRLPLLAVRHTGHEETDIQMLSRLWRNGRMAAYGMFLRSAVGSSWWWATVSRVRLLFFAPCLHAASLCLALMWALLGQQSSAVAFVLAEIGVWSGVVGLIASRKRSVRDAVLAVLAWHLYALAGLSGALRKVPNPMLPIDFRVIQ